MTVTRAFALAPYACSRLSRTGSWSPCRTSWIRCAVTVTWRSAVNAEG